MHEPAEGTAATGVAARPRIVGMLGSAWAATMGVLPHVLHHVGPLAGAAIVAGTTGTIVFGAATFLLTIPLLVRVRRRHGSWRLPLVLLALFVAIWSISTFAIGPWVRDQLADPPAKSQRQGDALPAGHEQHHDGS